MTKPQKPYWEMTTEELREATKKYDEPFVALDESRPLTPSQRRTLERSKRRGRPQVGKGAKRVLITVEGGLLKDMDAYAKRTGKSRSQLIAESVRSVISKKAG